VYNLLAGVDVDALFLEEGGSPKELPVQQNPDAKNGRQMDRVFGWQ
jgi:hypothetical protein